MGAHLGYEQLAPDISGAKLLLEQELRTECLQELRAWRLGLLWAGSQRRSGLLMQLMVVVPRALLLCREQGGGKASAATHLQPSPLQWSCASNGKCYVH